MSDVQFKEILDDYFENNEGTKDNFKDVIAGFNFTLDVPKSRLYIKLHKNCTELRREEIANGVRAFFRDELTILLDR